MKQEKIRFFIIDRRTHRKDIIYLVPHKVFIKAFLMVRERLSNDPDSVAELLNDLSENGVRVDSVPSCGLGVAFD